MSETTSHSTTRIPIESLSPRMQWISHATSFLGSLIKPLLIVTVMLVLAVTVTPERFHETLVLNILAFAAGYALLHIVRRLRYLNKRSN